MTYDTPADIEAYLRKDSGDAPASRYGVKAHSWIPVAVAACVIMSELTGEYVTADSIEHITGLVVNDHDDIEYLIREYGPEYGYDPEVYLS